MEKHKHKILVPLDGSEFGRQIFPHIHKFFSPQENRLILLRVGDDPPGHVGHPARPAAPDSNVEMFENRADYVETQHPIFASQERESILAEMEQALAPELTDLKEAGFDVETAVRFGHRGEAIVDFVDSKSVDMVAMTTHWRTGISKLIFGSVAQHVARHVSVPIVMVHPQDAV